VTIQVTGSGVRVLAMALLQRMEDGKWIPLITLLCPDHDMELASKDAEVEVREWRCPKQGCAVRVLVKSDRDRLKTFAKVQAF
jgi:hypothetical protein